MIKSLVCQGLNNISCVSIDFQILKAIVFLFFLFANALNPVDNCLLKQYEHLKYIYGTCYV